ncbi:MAG: substrate-binding domain-containing protein, partial [Thermomicrobiales bacterium]|nr:substrate-binding domain-containing protein [Thermomicrobiales bacterium]
ANTRVANPDATWLLPDDYHGGRLAATHLLRSGRRRIAHITGPAHWEAVRHRSDALAAVLAEHGLPLPEHRVLHGSWQEAWGYEAVGCVLERDPRVDAIFCGSDLIARGAMDGLRERGRTIPEDVAVVGFDNWEILASAARPPLTTVDPNLHEVGRAASARLLAMLEGEDGAGGVRLPCQLVVRASSSGFHSDGGRDRAGGDEAWPRS